MSAKSRAEISPGEFEDLDRVSATGGGVEPWKLVFGAAAAAESGGLVVLLIVLFVLARRGGKSGRLVSQSAPVDDDASRDDTSCILLSLCGVDEDGYDDRERASSSQ